MLAWVVINRQQPRQSRKSRPIRALPLPARLFNIPTFKPSNVQTYFPLSPAFSCDYKMQISHPLCFDIHTKGPGVYESVWVLGFCSWRPQHIVKEWLATHNLWPRLVVAKQTRVPPCWRCPHDRYPLDCLSSTPYHYPLSFHTLAHSFALFCTHAKLNSLVFNRLRTLCTKHAGVGGASYLALRCPRPTAHYPHYPLSPGPKTLSQAARGALR